MRQMFLDSVNREVAKNTFVEQGRIFVKQNVNETSAKFTCSNERI